ncbi:MAG: DUF1015 domain-containing protein [Candidatus Omnitrophica bacterium]|nr:DUF1015 domain-containing protein [Candidatus Omnitrophota bacterium]MBU2045041.1 DUF1015 domain-containing protein [Candidatus Omnitrophota bacterium]MBU2251295.1 DUF1015 domain-containing protein [Candidatus Omnitrophota bacterium]MBU2474263.1 DUF1015 domain-containing protein [Candidatus Omnitrophota bacterium]
MNQTIKPFKATYYNPASVKDYSAVTCPPYDVISSQQLKALRRKSPDNFSWVLIADNGNYKQSAQCLNRLLKDKILIDDDQDSLYLYEQTFKVKGKSLRRFGILSLLKMDKKGIFPHEYTLSAPKKDRKKIIASTKANLSPIFVIATKHLFQLEKIYQAYRKTKPFFKCFDRDSNLNKVWKISQRQEIDRLCREISASKMVIADGHHRFEITFDYFKKNKNRFKDLNYILAYLTGPQEGLLILPTHRIININQNTDSIFKTLQSYFHIQKVSQGVLEKHLDSQGQFCFGIFHKGKFFFLKLKDKKILDKIENKLYRGLDAYVFHQAVLPLFKSAGQIQYSHSIDESKAIAGKSDTAFILRAVPLETVLEISRKGFRFPQKSTYFYPKLLSGLVIRRFKNLSR